MPTLIEDLTSPSDHYRRRAQETATRVRRSTEIVEGVIRWTATDAVLSRDLVNLAAHIGLPVDAAACDSAREDDMVERAWELQHGGRTPCGKGIFI